MRRPRHGSAPTGRHRAQQTGDARGAWRTLGPASRWRIAGVLALVFAALTAGGPVTAGPGEARRGLVASGPADRADRAAPTPASTVTPARAQGGRLSGLPWMSGVHPANELPVYLQFGGWRGRPIDLALVYTDREDGWGPMVEPAWPVDDFASFPGTLVISQPMYPKGLGNNAECASGAYDAQWRRFGAFLASHGRAASIVRIGWEFNGLFNYWHADADPVNFRLCFQRVVTAIRATDPQVLVDWTFNAHMSDVPAGGAPWSAYPGDAYVDYVGIDSYDMSPASPTAASFHAQCVGANGLCTAASFARAHGKKLAVGEWGVVSCRTGGGGDNPEYIRQMWATFVANADVLGYEAYFSDPVRGNVCSTLEPGGFNPNAGREYRRLYAGGLQ